MTHIVSILAWPMTATAVVLALAAEFVVTRLAKRGARRRGIPWVASWLLAIVLFVVSQFVLWAMDDESILLVVQREAQAVLGWVLYTVFFLAIGWLAWRSRRKTADGRPRGSRVAAALIVGIAPALIGGFFAAQAARTFWLDAFTLPIRVEGRINRLWSERRYSLEILLGRWVPSRDAYVAVGGRAVQVTWDIYGSAQVGQAVALDIGRGSGRAIAISH